MNVSACVRAPSLVSDCANGRWWCSVSTSPFAVLILSHVIDVCVVTATVYALWSKLPMYYKEAEEGYRSDLHVEDKHPWVFHLFFMCVRIIPVSILAKGLLIHNSWSKQATLARDTGSNVRNTLSSNYPLPVYHLCSFSCYPVRFAGLVCIWVLVGGAVFTLLGAQVHLCLESLQIAALLGTLALPPPITVAILRANAHAYVQLTLAREARKPPTKIEDVDDIIQAPSLCARADEGEDILLGAIGINSGDSMWIRMAVRALDCIFSPLGIVGALASRVCVRHRVCAADVGQWVFVCTMLPFVICCILTLAGCYVLPLDWGSVYIKYPSPQMFGILLGQFVGSIVSVFVLLFLPFLCVFSLQDAYGSFIMQHLMLHDESIAEYALEELSGEASDLTGVTKATEIDGRDTQTTTNGHRDIRRRITRESSEDLPEGMCVSGTHRRTSMRISQKQRNL